MKEVSILSNDLTELILHVDLIIFLLVGLDSLEFLDQFGDVEGDFLACHLNTGPILPELLELIRGLLALLAVVCHAEIVLLAKLDLE